MQGLVTASDQMYYRLVSDSGSPGREFVSVLDAVIGSAQHESLQDFGGQAKGDTDSQGRHRVPGPTGRRAGALSKALDLI